MKILFLTPQTPYPPDQGAAIRNFNFIKYLATEQQAEVFLLSFDRPGENREIALTELAKYCREITLVAAPANRSKIQRIKDLVVRPEPDLARRLVAEGAEFGQKLAGLVQQIQPDIIQCEGLELALFALDWLKSFTGKVRPKLVLDEHNAEYLLQQRIYEQERSNGLKRLPIAFYSRLQAGRLAKFERTALSSFDQIIAVSEPDKAALEKLATPRRELAVVPNGIDVDEFSPRPEQMSPNPATIVFTGTMDYRPNIDAVNWFGRQVWPYILAQEPAAKFYIVGRRPSEAVQALKTIPGIEVTGAVADARPYIAQSSIYVVPMRVGGGVRFKVLEAMAMGKPVVTTSLGADGIRLTPEQDALLADGPLEFAQAILSLLANPTRQAGLAANGRGFVEKYYAWPKILPQLGATLNRLIAK